MRKFLYNLLITICPNVYQQGTVSENSYPDDFITFWNFSNDEPKNYDNDTISNISGWWVYFYSTNPENVDIKSKQIKALLKQNGFILNGNAKDISVDVKTHTGCFMTAYFEEKY